MVICIILVLMMWCGSMSNRHFSRFYKGFLVHQTDVGWYIHNFPDWCKLGPMQCGPFVTYDIAYNTIDRLLRANG